MGGASAGPCRLYRLDPDSLGAPAPLAAGGADLTIDIARAVVVRRAGEGPARVVPFSAYRGVAVRMEGTRDPGRVRVFLELLHTDPALTFPLAIAEDPDGVVADWQTWGKLFALPLLVVAPDGTVSAPLASLGGLTVFPPKARRRPAHFSARRPRFLVRRKTGRATGLSRIAGREIIART